MRVTQMLRSGDSRPFGKFNHYMGGWGDFGGAKQKGIVSYALSQNRQRPLAGALHAAIFNTARRCGSQFLYVVPPFVLAYFATQWCIERNEYLNSKAGRAEFGDSE